MGLHCIKMPEDESMSLNALSALLFPYLEKSVHLEDLEHYLSQSRSSFKNLRFVRSSVESELGGKVEALRGVEHTTFSIQIPHAV